MTQGNPDSRRHKPAEIEVPAGGARVLESRHSKDFRMKVGTWPFHKICWVSVGFGWLEFSGNQAPIQPDDFLLLPARTPHRFIDDPSEPLTLVIVCIAETYTSKANDPKLDALWQLVLERSEPGSPHCARSAFHRSTLIEHFRLALREQLRQQPGWEIALGGAANKLLIQLARKHCVAREGFRPDSAQAIEGALEYLNTHFYEAQRIDDMAERCQLSPRRFTQLFKERTGQTFSNYLNLRRIEFAQERLRQTGHILYACHESGFNDLAYFYRVFRKCTGQTPGEYLAKMQLDSWADQSEKLRPATKNNNQSRGKREG